MGGRYLVTGMQLGILESIANQSSLMLGEASMLIIREILNNQFIVDSEKAVEDDVIVFRKITEGERG